MLDKFRGIKPTHLWHHTSLKAFRAAIKDRYDAVKNLDELFNKPKQTLAFAGFVWTSMLAIFYSLGAITPEETLKDLLPYECKPSLPQDMDVCTKEEKKVKTPACPPSAKKKPC
ncbi:uncharacterized protein LOC120633600 [Pararge aegeria]|uniref:Jg12016 protein n=1 Tax=Pararge aegeria aegeria TaxID=348720 RepID=A0A8S4R622_9NEOP|nr:uncharacterized protein LOC120633600 [Pararge aegeria]CAH2230714.1 jg12016 [Pararge aegeria aegeria]